MTNPRVTIGLPVYNGERFLAAAIDSILAQDFDDFELLIGDNGSTDRTPEIARAAAERDARVVVHRSDINRGASWNYNRLVDLARGEYFKWEADDDLLEPQWLRRCVEVLDARPEVALCYTKVVDIDEADQVVRRFNLPAYATEDRPSRRARRVLFQPSPCFESFGLMRRSDAMRTSRIGPYTGSDRTLILELALLGRFYEVPEELFLHREHAGRSMSCYPDTQSRNIWFDPLRSGKLTAPRWRLLREYIAAIARAPIPVSERLRIMKLLRWWTRANRKELTRDIAAIARGRARAAPRGTVRDSESA